MKRSLELNMIFKERTPSPFDWGTDAIVYKVYLTEEGKMQVMKQGEFGDWTLEKFSKVTSFEEGAEWIQEIAKMSYEEFKKFLI